MKFPTTWVQTHYQSPLGAMRLAASPKGLTGVWFVEGQKYLPDFDLWGLQADHPVLQQTRQTLDAYFAGQNPRFQVPMDLSIGTEFQQKVWLALCAIAPGTTTSYGALARTLGRPDAVRAAATAIGRNPISILVPCHRVIGAGGSLVGYAGGLHRKAALLQLEGAISGDLFEKVTPF
jgi:methylated-DNA-[protein]-cysteine S-methyltransferase